jgi:hypothetical protein
MRGNGDTLLFPDRIWYLVTKAVQDEDFVSSSPSIAASLGTKDDHT